MRLQTLVAFFPLFWGLISGEIYSSLSHMKGLVRLERILSQSLDRYLRKQPDVPEILRDFADYVRKESSIAAGDIERYLWHPVNCFQLVRRFTRHWRELDLYLSHAEPNDLQRELFMNRPSFPNSHDLMGVISAILRIQEVYNISARAIADGKLYQDKTTTAGFGADECYEVGIVSNRLQHYDDVKEWMHEAMKRMSPPYEYRGSVTKIDVLEYLSWAEYQVGLIDDAIRHTKDILQRDPDKQSANTNLGHFNLEKLNSNSAKTKKMVNNRNKNKEDFMFTYERLCRGESRKTQKDRDKLTCHYNKNLPSLLLKPIKVETMNLEPELYLLHDVISDSEAEHVKTMAKPLLKRAVVTNTSNGDQIATNFRISQSAWLEDTDSPVVEKISQRIETITGLSLDQEHAEPLQDLRARGNRNFPLASAVNTFLFTAKATMINVASYGIGGHYEPHHDFVQNSDGTIPAGGGGDRIATMLFYLSDVDAGGATVFLHMEEVVFPQKGDAVFWYNLDKTGRPDSRTRHAACPVIVGLKWVANKWINERGQEFRRPCPAYQPTKRESVDQ